MRVIVYLVTTVGALTALATTASAGSSSSCSTSRTFEQAAQADGLPAIVAALHGGAAPSDRSRRICVTAKR